MFPGHSERIIITIEARMASSRLPGKVLLPLSGVPALAFQIERLRSSQYADGIVVATTENAPDEAVERVARQAGAEVFRGSEEDVLSRVLRAARGAQADLIVELTGDCPLLDGQMVDRGIEEFFSRPVDYAANCLTPSYPLGFETQVFPVKVLAQVDGLTRDPIDRIHVSYYIYQHPNRYRIHAWSAPPEAHAPDLRLTLDEPADYALLDALCRRFHPRTDFTAAECVALLKEDAALTALNQHILQKHAQQG